MALYGNVTARTPERTPGQGLPFERFETLATERDGDDRVLLLVPMQGKLKAFWLTLRARYEPVAGA